MHKTKEVLQITASALTICVGITFFIIFFYANSLIQDEYLLNSYWFMLVILFVLLLLNIIMLTKLNKEKTYAFIRILSCIFIFLVGMSCLQLQNLDLFQIAFAILFKIFVICETLFILTFCLGNNNTK